jgi:4'-phosphopantetheinyl transferase
VRTPERIGPVELWRFDLGLTATELAQCWDALSEHDRVRADKLSSPEVHRRFVAARGGLRQTLAGYVGVRAAALVLTGGAHGKPVLPGGPSFSLSHSGDLALCAVVWNRAVGVDLEQMRPIPEADSIAAGWFGPLDWATYRAAGDDRQREDTFLRLWTRREAYLKARGVGITSKAPPEDIDPRLWEVRELHPGEGYVGALVWEQTPLRFPCASPGAQGR